MSRIAHVMYLTVDDLRYPSLQPSISNFRISNEVLRSYEMIIYQNPDGELTIIKNRIGGHTITNQNNTSWYHKL